jgi:hypothetical protein
MFDRKHVHAVTLIILFAVLNFTAQLSATSSFLPQNAAPSNLPAPDPSAILSRLEQQSQAITQDLGRLRIDKWKADSATKQQANSNALSIQRNLTAALPGMIQQVRTNPQNLATNFKLYRNVNALYEVLAILTESAGAFGGNSEYQALGPHVGAIDDIRRSYAELLENMATQQDAQLAAARAAAAQAATPPPAPQKIIVDDTPPPTKKAPKKKKPTTTAPTKPANETAPPPKPLSQ